MSRPLWQLTKRFWYPRWCSGGTYASGTGVRAFDPQSGHTHYFKSGLWLSVRGAKGYEVSITPDSLVFRINWPVTLFKAASNTKKQTKDIFDQCMCDNKSNKDRIRNSPCQITQDYKSATTESPFSTSSSAELFVVNKYPMITLRGGILFWLKPW